MLGISLMRMGAKKKPFYRIVVKEKRSKRDGKYLENVGTYNPMADPAEVKLVHDRIQYWMSVGAQPTETVASLIKHNPVQTEEEKEAAVQAKAAKAEAEKAARAEEKKAKAAKLEAERAEAAKAEADKAAAEKAETEKAEADAAAATETTEATTEKAAPDAETPEENKPEASE
ncbi:MAG TPA: 30S ribosomal protein S16 [Pyrinomonadaceae bacterium]|nr:30S ribosomal protein S16 [Pyrinomonadaceae bacterium]